MFGSSRRRAAHQAPVVTTTRTTRTSHSSGGLMNRLRPRRNTPPLSHGYGHGTSTVSATHVSHAPRTKRSGFGRKKRVVHSTHHHQPTTVVVAPARKPSMGDKMSGAMTKLRGSLTGRPAVKAAGTRQMHGVGSTRRYY